jgi:DNA-directed RNA polymerase specialized sigma24 family protein
MDYRDLFMSAPDRNPETHPSWTELLNSSDTDLAGFWTSGVDDAFAAIVDRYQRLVFSVTVRIVKDEGEAEDVVQIVFLDIFRDVGKFDASRGTLKVWLLQYAYSRSMNRRQHLECRQFYSKTDEFRLCNRCDQRSAPRAGQRLRCPWRRA